VKRAQVAFHGVADLLTLGPPGDVPRAVLEGYGPGEELEGRPIIGLSVSARRSQERQLGAAKGFGGPQPLRHFGVEVRHQFRCGPVADVPQSGNYVARPGLKESPRKSDQSLAGIRPRAGAPASGDGDEIGVERQRCNVPCIQLVGIALRGQDDG